MELKEFLRRAWGSQEGWVFVGWTNHKPQLDNPAKKNFRQKSYKFPGELDTLLNDVNRFNNWASVYFSVHLYSDKAKRVKEYAKPVTCLWIDYDKSDPHNIDPKPTICWATSENRYQAIWILDQPINPQLAEEVNRYLTYKNNGDKGKWALTTYFRFPLTKNFKYNPPYKGHFMWTNGPVYSIDDLRPPRDVDINQLVAVTLDTEMPKSFPDLAEVYRVYGHKFSPVVWNLLNATPKSTDDWSEQLWRLERLLLEAGLPMEAVFVVCKNSPWNKYQRDGRPDIHLWQDLLRAKSHTGTTEPSSSVTWLGIDSLLTYHRKPEWLVEDIWMESNVGWIAGIGKSYKSTISLDLALSIASGTPFLGKFKVNKPGPVLMIQEEDPVWRVSRRLQAMARKKNVVPMRLSKDMYGITLTVDEDKPIPLYSCVGSGLVLTDPEFMAEIEAKIAECRPRFVLLDPWYQISAGLDEFKASEVTKLLVQIKQWRNKYDCAVGIVHHYRKSGGGDGRDKLYGSMAFYSWSENSLFVNRKPDGNIVEIQRDIKDAINVPPFAVEFFEIDEDYDFVVLSADQVKASEDKLRSFLLTREVGNKFSRNELASLTGYSPKTVSAKLKDFAEKGYVSLTYEGQGGQMHATILPKLFEGGEVFGF